MSKQQKRKLEFSYKKIKEQGYRIKADLTVTLTNHNFLFIQPLKRYFKLSISFIFILNQACAQKNESYQKEKNLKTTLIDSLKFVSIIPDENFYPKGGAVYSKILTNSKKLTPKLISKISDTTNTKYSYADSYFFKVGDISLDLLTNTYNQKEFPIRKILIANFELKNPNDHLYTIYYDLFHSNTSQINLQKRLILKKALEDWYENLN